MGIPRGTPLDDWLESVTLTRPADVAGWASFELMPTRGKIAGSRTWHAEPVLAWYPTSSGVTPQGVCKRISNELDKRGHLIDEAVAEAVLALVCIRAATAGTGIEVLARLLESVTPTKAAQYLIARVPQHPDSARYSLGEFQIGLLERQKLAYRCKRIGCDYFDLYPDSFRGAAAIERTEVPINCISIEALRGIVRVPRGSADFEYEVIDQYYYRLAEVQLVRFREAFMESQYVVVAGGAPVIDIFDPGFWIGSSFVCVYTWGEEGKLGYFCPMQQLPIVDFACADQRVPATMQRLRNLYGFEGLSGSDLHQLVRTFCRFVTNARLEDQPGNTDAVFLNYCIALDLVFGERDASNQNISERVGLIASAAAGRPFDDYRQMMKHLYGVRSRFVHAGEPVPKVAIEQIKPLIDAVFTCLMRLQSRAESHRKGFPEQWLRQLDFLIAAHAAGRTVIDADLVAAGIGREVTS
jgi:hypothetical protein